MFLVASCAPRAVPEESLAVVEARREHGRGNDVTLPRDGSYDVIVRATSEGMTEDSPAVLYRLGVSRDRVIKDVVRLGVKPALGVTLHFSAGIGYGRVSLPDRSFNGEAISVHGGPGYQVSERIGIDVIADVCAFLNPTAPLAGVGAMLGPRLRYGNKNHGFVGVSAGPSLLMTLTSVPDDGTEPQTSGVAARADYGLALSRGNQPRSKMTMRFFIQHMWHGESSYFAAGFAVSL